MGALSASGNDLAHQYVSGTFTATGQSGNATTGFADGTSQSGQTVPPAFVDLFNIALWGTFSATVQLEKSYNGGTTWLPCCEDNSGTAAAYTSAVNLSAFEPERGVLYRWNCTAFTSGTVNYRISQ